MGVTNCVQTAPHDATGASAVTVAGTGFKPPHHNASAEESRPTQLKEHHLELLVVTASVKMHSSHHPKGPKA